MDAGIPKARVLVIGLDPFRVPGPWDPTPVADAIKIGMARFAEHGVGVETCLFGLDGSDDIEAVVGAALRAGSWEVVVVGGGVRMPDEQVELFEMVINLVRQLAPDAAIAFNRTPAETFDAAARWLDHDGGARAVNEYVARPVARVSSDLRDLAAAPRQGDEGAPDAWIVFDEAVRPAWADLAVGDHLVLITYLDRADRSVLTVHPRGDANRPLTGVFSTRSPHRPNPLGLHEVVVVDVAADRIWVSGLEAVDGTPVIDIKPVLAPLDADHLNR